MTSPRSTCTDEWGWGGGSCGEIGKGHVHFSASILSLSLHTDTHTSLIRARKHYSHSISTKSLGKEAVKRGKGVMGREWAAFSLGSTGLCTCLGKP